ncbi:MAG: citrate lyase holo-[acyl-carrier protein] synthase [Clostridiales bacterium]|nr:citrate lyase holo-[acyl-carrier protein] synthase [Clostridiales bacterium]
MIGILQAREERYEKILELINKKLGTVLCAKINYPGKDKNTYHSKKAFNILKQSLLSLFKENIVLTKDLQGLDGDSLLLVLNLNIVDAKRMSIDVENNHPLGRLFDIDIYNEEGTPISREKFDLKPRGCIVCGKNARECILNNNHSIYEILNKVNVMIDSFGDEYAR